MKKSLKCSSGPKRKANRRRQDDPETRKRKRHEKGIIATAIKKATRHFAPDQDWL